MELFDSSEFVLKNPHDDKTCKDCEHRQRWQCGGSVIQYCSITKSNKTHNGLLKIKCKDIACSKFKESKRYL